MELEKVYADIDNICFFEKGRCQENTEEKKLRKFKELLHPSVIKCSEIGIIDNTIVINFSTNYSLVSETLDYLVNSDSVQDVVDEGNTLIVYLKDQ